MPPLPPAYPEESPNGNGQAHQETTLEQPDETASPEFPEPVPGESEKRAASQAQENLSLEEDATYLVTVILKNRGDTMRDKLRLRQVYGTLISYPGKDRFAFQIIENEKTHLLEFPNASTKISKPLLIQLREMLGRENVQVEKYLI
jgi:hypothetical protein